MPTEAQYPEENLALVGERADDRTCARADARAGAAADVSAAQAPLQTEEHWLALPDGRMRYLKAGSGPALILLHGLMGYSFSWRFTMPALAPYATVYAIDNLGAGFSIARQGMDCSVRATAERVLQFADAVGIDGFDLLGTSHGGGVAMMEIGRAHV